MQEGLCLFTEMNMKHGAAKRGKIRREFRSWQSAIDRCYNAHRKDFKHYGGATPPVTVCERWRHSFKNFFDDMGPCPKGMTLDRYPNKAGNYEPGNCRWATLIEQANNKCNSTAITWCGRTQTLAQWSRELGLNYKVVWQRIHRDRQSLDQAFGQVID